MTAILKGEQDNYEMRRAFSIGGGTTFVPIEVIERVAESKEMSPEEFADAYKVISAYERDDALQGMPEPFAGAEQWARWVFKRIE